MPSSNRSGFFPRAIPPSGSTPKSSNALWTHRTTPSTESSRARLNSTLEYSTTSDFQYPSRVTCKMWRRRLRPDRTFGQLTDDFIPMLNDVGMVGRTAWAHAINLAQRTHLVRAFSDPDAVLQRVTAKIQEVVQTFPREAADIERGRNPGDVLDPFILTATQTLLFAGNFQEAIGATVAHKALMIIEGLMGHLHEDVIGMMRGNVRAPEPRGFNQEQIDPHDNPFPGADVVQPPIAVGGALRVHQVKSKTGSAKGGDGKRLGDQLRRLREFYHADVFYDALIGNTLRGHRSMRGVLTSEPQAIVLVGDAAFRELTRSSIGPELLLRVYQKRHVRGGADHRLPNRRDGHGYRHGVPRAIQPCRRGLPRFAALEFHWHRTLTSRTAEHIVHPLAAALELGNPANCDDGRRWSEVVLSSSATLAETGSDAVLGFAAPRRRGARLTRGCLGRAPNTCGRCWSIGTPTTPRDARRAAATRTCRTGCRQLLMREPRQGGCNA